MTLYRVYVSGIPIGTFEIANDGKTLTRHVAPVFVPALSLLGDYHAGNTATVLGISNTLDVKVMPRRGTEEG